MVNINRHELTKRDLEHLFNQFDTSLGKLERNGVSIFLNELLGREERITLAKRFSAIILLIEGTSEYKTAKVLKLSPTTTGKISFEIKRGTYAELIALLQKNKRDYLKILVLIDSVLHLGGLLPHRVGLDRYRHL